MHTHDKMTGATPLDCSTSEQFMRLHEELKEFPPPPWSIRGDTVYDGHGNALFTYGATLDATNNTACGVRVAFESVAVLIATWNGYPKGLQVLEDTERKRQAAQNQLTTATLNPSSVTPKTVPMPNTHYAPLSTRLLGPPTRAELQALRDRCGQLERRLATAEALLVARGLPGLLDAASLSSRLQRLEDKLQLLSELQAEPDPVVPT